MKHVLRTWMVGMSFLQIVFLLFLLSPNWGWVSYLTTLSLQLYNPEAKLKKIVHTYITARFYSYKHFATNRQTIKFIKKR